MPTIQTDFEWYRDPDGYQIVMSGEPDCPNGLLRHPMGIRVMPSNLREQPLRIVRHGDRTDRYRPLDQFDALYKVFVAVRTPTQLLDFVEKFGPITEGGLDPEIGDPVDFALVHVEAMQEFLSYCADGRSGRAILVETQANPIAEMAVALVFDPISGFPNIRLKPKSLLDAMWLQLGLAASGDAPIRSCRFCGTWFTVGPGTGRRLDAAFCSDKHRITFNSLKRTKGK